MSLFKKNDSDGKLGPQRETAASSWLKVGAKVGPLELFALRLQSSIPSDHLLRLDIYLYFGQS